MAEILEFLKVYEKGGMTLLILAALMLVSMKLYTELREKASVVEKVTQALDRSSENSSKASECMSSIRASMDSNRNQNAEFLAYLKGRDEGRKAQ